ncbi:hypothetical protein GPL15_06375 [Clostridium sp. MCC353]|uniref:hypothetical protein n=1 Tax=Clostridium sp. MCC353 TaxID=2592646 RepID=UPI001C018475|nr:hypothetical protein [Clostridium sp. MCC353]MBT9776130.1 hypothetical protein [Clostridium sp. MCC353]
MKNSVTVKIGRAGETVIQPNLFAHNLEHTRSCMYHGLSAQMIRNRKFAGKPACRTGVADQWYRIGRKEVYMTLDRMDSYVRHVNDSGVRRNECNSLIIQNPFEGMEAGIGQDGIYLEKGKYYKVSAVIKCRGENRFPCRIRIISGSRETVYAYHEVLPEQGRWEKTGFCFKAEESDANARLELVFSSKGEVKAGVVSMLPEDNFHGMRRDVVELLKEMGVTVLRWPGGNFAGEYRWKDGLLDVDERGALLSYRSVETHPHTGGFDFHEMGVDDFIALCREIGAQPYITINLAWDSPKESGEFVEYCNGSEETVWGQKRCERGNREPYNVKFWSLGNEFGLGHMEGPNTPKEYSEKALLCAEKMKEADDTIILFASGAYSPEHDSGLWVKESLPRLAPVIDYISYHYYLPRLFESGMDFITESGLRECWKAVLQAPQHCAGDLKHLREKMDSGTEEMKKVKIAFDEWNLYFTWYHDPCVLEGLYTALMLEMFCRKQDAYKMMMAMYFQPVNEGAVNVYPGHAELTANGQVFKLMKAHRGNRLLVSETTDSSLHCLVSENEDKTVITLINTDYDSDMEVKFEGIAVSGAEKREVLRGTEILHGYKFIEETIAGDSETLAVPKRSIVQIEMGNGSEE